MGAWGDGPFENDEAADLIAEGDGSRASLEKILRRCADTPAAEYLDVDDGHAAIAACEIVAQAFGVGTVDKVPGYARAAARNAKDDSLRQLAIRALQRVRGPNSEAASLRGDPAFDARLEELAGRLSSVGR